MQAGKNKQNTKFTGPSPSESEAAIMIELSPVLRRAQTSFVNFDQGLNNAQANPPVRANRPSPVKKLEANAKDNKGVASIRSKQKA